MTIITTIETDELATILAALRFYQEKGQGDPANRSDAIHDIATACDQVVSLGAEAIDDLCERLNTSNSVESTTAQSLEDQFRGLLTRGLIPATVRQIMAEGDHDNYALHIEEARKRWATDELEIDDAPEVSEASGGCWVAGWVWVSDEDAGITTAQDEDEEEPALA